MASEIKEKKFLDYDGLVEVFKKVLHKKTQEIETNDLYGIEEFEKTPKKVDPDTLDYGDLGVNYAEGFETLMIKNNKGEVIGFVNRNDFDEAIDTLVKAIALEHGNRIDYNTIIEEYVDRLVFGISQEKSEREAADSQEKSEREAVEFTSAEAFIKIARWFEAINEKHREDFSKAMEIVVAAFVTEKEERLVELNQYLETFKIAAAGIGEEKYERIKNIEIEKEERKETEYILTQTIIDMDRRIRNIEKTLFYPKTVTVTVNTQSLTFPIPYRAEEGEETINTLAEQGLPVTIYFSKPVKAEDIIEHLKFYTDGSGIFSVENKSIDDSFTLIISDGTDGLSQLFPFNEDYENIKGCTIGKNNIEGGPNFTSIEWV